MTTGTSTSTTFESFSSIIGSGARIENGRGWASYPGVPVDITPTGNGPLDITPTGQAGTQVP
jgi:hypothetical protein